MSFDFSKCTTFRSAIPGWPGLSAEMQNTDSSSTAVHPFTKAPLADFILPRQWAALPLHLFWWSPERSEETCWVCTEGVEEKILI